ncbi:hypothetical protein BDZ90DRAFT_258449 [Jaminaea rosea]|uniref:Conserved oligomeric Golgi complex subunit 6 n=1 Tax=Jaminaea rosea TaxID=1569628 RepID=A0A316UX37_9BASI|nr:hypothetical protein BDZ90DRAFT_258449 [Jaminaea rosea]PWN29534.1 hypothetical protein BDZ90DRAFT_258449 [Jaminaea rosea]
MLSPTLNGGNDAALDAAGPSAPPSSAQRGAGAHPFSLKVRSILTRPPSSRDDELVAKGLRALEGRYALGGQATQSWKNNKAVKQRKSAYRLLADSSDEEDGLDFPTSSSHPAASVQLSHIKSHLTQDAHADLLTSTTQYLAHLDTVTDHLDSIHDRLASMRATCDSVDSSLSHSNDSVRYLLEQSAGLERQRGATKQQALLARLFLERFTLPPAEREAIERRDSPVGHELFAAMDRLAVMRQDCLALLEGGGEAGGGTRAGTDVMASTGQLLDLAHEKLGRFLNFEFRQAPKEGLDVGPILRDSVRRLVEAEAGKGEEVLAPALGILAGMRSTYLAGAFQQALQRGSGEGSSAANTPSFSRPIEMHAHDPLRYVGDMLAWVHQAVAGEREFLGQLFGEKEGEGGRRVGERRRGIEGSIDWGRRGSQMPEATQATATEATTRRLHYVRDTLNRSLEGCSRPLSVRVEQTIDVQSSPLVALRLAHLVDFYRQVMLDTLGSKATLSKVLDDLNKTAWTAFGDAVKRQARELDNQGGEVPAMRGDGEELGLPASLLSALSSVKELMEEHGHQAPSSASDTAAESVLVAADQQSKESEGQADETTSFASVLSTLLDAMLRQVDTTQGLIVEAAQVPSPAKGSKSPSKSDDPDSAATAHAQGLVFRLNCLERIVTTLERSSSAASSSPLLAPPRTALTATHRDLVDSTYAHVLVTSGLSPALSESSSAATLECLQSFSARLSSPSGSLSLATPPSWLSRVQAPRQRSEVHAEAMRRLVEGYEGAMKRCEAVEGLRSAEEARMLLGV